MSEQGTGKNTIVDVRCTDHAGRHFIVEMQIAHHAYFLERLLFNAAKVFSSQLERGDRYVKIQPVYAISIMDDAWERGIREGKAKGLAEGEQHAYNNIMSIVEDLRAGLAAEVVAEKYSVALHLVEALRFQ